MSENKHIDSRIQRTDSKTAPKTRSISPYRAGLIGAMAVLTPPAVMGAMELDEHLNNRDSVQEVVDRDETKSSVSLPIDTGDSRSDSWNEAQSIADPANPNKDARQQSQQAAREALGQQP